MAAVTSCCGALWAFNDALLSESVSGFNLCFSLARERKYRHDELFSGLNRSFFQINAEKSHDVTRLRNVY